MEGALFYPKNIGEAGLVTYSKLRVCAMKEKKVLVTNSKLYSVHASFVCPCVYNNSSGGLYGDIQTGTADPKITA